jgi:hypothetical protein
MQTMRTAGEDSTYVTVVSSENTDRFETRREIAEFEVDRESP